MMQYMDRIYYRMLKERRWLVTILLAGGLIVWAELAAGMSMQESLAEQVIRLRTGGPDHIGVGGFPGSLYRGPDASGRTVPDISGDIGRRKRT